MSLGTHIVLCPGWWVSSVERTQGGTYILELSWGDWTESWRRIVSVLISASMVCGLVSSFPCKVSRRGSYWMNFLILVFPSWSSIRTAFPFCFLIMFYRTGSKFGDNLFSWVLVGRIWSPSITSLYSTDCLVSAYSLCLSFAHASHSQRSCCQWASLILSLGIVPLGSLSLSCQPIESSAGDSPVEVWGVVR